MKLISTLGTLSAALAIGLIPQAASAGLVLQLRSDGVAITIADGSALDADGSANGVVSFNGQLNAWIINATTGIARSQGNQLELTLASVNVSAPGASNLLMSLTETGLQVGSPWQSISTTFEGRVGTQADYRLLLDDASAQSGTPQQLFAGHSGAGQVKDSGTTSVDLPDPFSLTLELHLAPSTFASTFTYTTLLSPAAGVPEPASLALAALALASLVAVRRPWPPRAEQRRT